jgi:nucleoid-associated protein YgaU
MQSIERYGIITLTLLVVTVLAVLMWDSDDVQANPGDPVQVAAKKDARPGAARRTSAMQDPAGARDSIATVSSRPRALRRDLEAQREGPRVRDLAQGAGGGPPSVAQEPPSSSGPVQLDTGRAADRLDPRRANRRLGQENQALTRPEPRVWVVKAGDTLSEISQEALGTSKRWQEIVDANPGLDPNRLKVGARLKLPTEGVTLPAGRASEPSPRVAQGDPQPAGSATWRVRAGDSLWKIAQRALGDGERWREIAALNPEIDPSRIREGQSLRLPSGARAQAAPSRTTVVAQNGTPAPRRGRVR